jgi:hypothetical protein
MLGMRRKTHTALLALAAGATLGAPLAVSSSCSQSSGGPATDAGADVTIFVPGVCGDGVLNLGEQCDRGTALNMHGSGCEPDCTYSCIPDTLNGNAVCDDHNECNGVETCIGENDAGHPSHTCVKGTPPGDGTACGNGSTCKSGVCLGAAVCGNAIVENGEECDDGSNNGTGACTTSCHWTCVAGDSARSCAPTDSCSSAGTCDGIKHTCTTGAAVADGTPCGDGGAGQPPRHAGGGGPPRAGVPLGQLRLGELRRRRRRGPRAVRLRREQRHRHRVRGRLHLLVHALAERLHHARHVRRDEHLHVVHLGRLHGPEVRRRIAAQRRDGVPERRDVQLEPPLREPLVRQRHARERRAVRLEHRDERARLWVRARLHLQLLDEPPLAERVPGVRPLQHGAAGVPDGVGPGE